MSRSKHKRRRKSYPKINSKKRILYYNYINHHPEEGFVKGAHRFSIKQFRKIIQSSLRNLEKIENKKLKLDPERNFVIGKKFLNNLIMYW